MNTPVPCIAVMAKNLTDGVGMDGNIPWQCPLDMKVFRCISANSFMIMGRKTLESFPKALTSLNRFNICITRKQGDELIPLKEKYPNVMFTNKTDIISIEEDAYEFFKKDDIYPLIKKHCIIGGVEILDLFNVEFSALFLSSIKDMSLCDRFIDDSRKYGRLIMSQTPLFLDDTNYQGIQVFAKDGIMKLPYMPTLNQTVVFETIQEVKTLLDTWHPNTNP